MTNIKVSTRTPTAPWPGKDYYIFLKGSPKGIVDNHDASSSLQILDSSIRRDAWRCCERDGAFIFRGGNEGDWIQPYGKFLIAEAAPTDVNSAQRFHARHHPQGGYQLLLLPDPEANHGIKEVCLDSDGETLILKERSMCVWEFIEVN